jgi:hypothetical protein
MKKTKAERDDEPSRAQFSPPPGWAIELPSRLHELWPWFAAVWSFDYGDPAPLAELIRAGDVPIEFRVAVADIAQGIRKPNLRAAAKAKIPASERAKLAASISVILGLRDSIKFRALGPNESLRPGAVSVGDYCQQEPIEVMREADERGREIMLMAAEEFRVSLETIENLMREARDRLSRWPVV